VNQNKPSTKGRDDRGRFAPGNSLSPGRPSKEREKQYLAAFDKALPANELSTVVAAVLVKAKSGSIPAARLLLEYAIGRPIQRFEFEDESEYRVAGENPRENLERMQTYIAERVQQMRDAEAERNRATQPPRDRA